jgi:pimeloyl-ACP methyl ester carboxylesterase
MATFLLVHGTFAKSANWPALQDGLAEVAHEAGEKASFKQLAWSGKNRAAARESAASAILKSVQEIQSNSSNEKIFLIGHSHGGSAIAYFLKEHPEAANTLAGCAFLSTPFVAIRPRRNAFRLMALLLFFPYIFFMNIIPPPYYDTLPPEDLPLWTSADLFHWFIMSVGIAIYFLALFFIKKASDPHKVEQSIREQTADIPAGKYLFLRCSGDEAAAALSAVEFIAWLGMKAARLPELITRAFDPSRGAVRLFVLGGVFGLATGLITFGWVKILKFGFWRYFLSPDGPFIEHLWIVKQHLQDLQGSHILSADDVLSIFVRGFEILYALLAVVVICLVLLCLFAVLLIFVTQAVTSWAFGWTRLSTGFLVQLAIEPLPFGEHSLIHIDWATGSIGLDGMVHSWTYAHPVAIWHLRNWVKASLVAHSPSSSENLQPKELLPANAS